MDMGDMTYTMIRVGDGTGGGLMKNPMPNSPSLWVAYVDVPDVKAATNKAKSLGAKVVKEVAEIKGAGSFSIISDPRARCWVFGRPRRASAREAGQAPLGWWAMRMGRDGRRKPRLAIPSRAVAALFDLQVRGKLHALRFRAQYQGDDRNQGAEDRAVEHRLRKESPCPYPRQER